MQTQNYSKLLLMEGEKKKFIPRVRVGDVVYMEQNQKEEVFTVAFETMLGTDQARDFTIDLEYLDVQPIDLAELDTMFTE